MQISLVSDLHLEWGYQEMPGGDVLILSGDICEARTFLNEFHKTKLLNREAGSFKSYDFFYHECAKYEKVFMVMGNHEHYHGRFDQTYAKLKSALPLNVTLLEKESVEYKGVVFIGATLWTNCNRGDPITVHTLKYGMNDFKIIQNYYADKNLYHKLTPEFTVYEHRKTLDYFKTVLAEYHDKPVVVITHHGPSHMSIHGKYQGDMAMNGGYVSDLSEFILDHPNIKVWTHGHVHNQFDYMIGDTRVIAKPRGYVGHEDTSEFDPTFTFEVL